jgi:hypothetical protein
LPLSTPGWLNVDGIGRNRHLLGGQMITNARPTTIFSGTVPPKGSSVCILESLEMAR